MTAEPQKEAILPVLTIAIPTYNRSAFLSQLLLCLCGDLRNESRVELIVSDNCSMDDTPAVVSRYQGEGLAIRYLRNQANIGADANFVQCFESALGKYVWIIGDDDLLVPGAVPAILAYCESANYDMLYVSQFALKVEPDKLTRIKIADAIEIRDPREYARRIDVFFTFISANIVNKDRVTASTQRDFSELIGTNLGQLGWTYSALNCFEQGLFIKDRLLGARVNNAGGYALFNVFGPNLKRVTESWVKNVDVQKVILNGTLRRFLPGFALKHKRSNNPFKDEGPIQKILTPVFKKNPRYWVCLYPILVLPFVFAACWFVIIRTYNRLTTLWSH